LTRQNSYAFVFPAFINEYPEEPFGNSPELKKAFTFLLETAASKVDPGLALFDFSMNPLLDDELRTQYITFIYSCAAGDILEKNQIRPDFSAGYSLGLYAALIHAKAISFGDGLYLIRKAFETILECVNVEKYGMCSVIGLSREEIETLIDGNRWRIRIVNRNCPVAFVLSGQFDDIQSFKEAAIEEGALNVHLLNVTLPYHSGFLANTKSVFGKFIDSMDIKKPETRIISLIDQRIIIDKADIRKELVSNLFTPLNWYLTQSALMELGVNRFVECGPGKSLVKNAKFIEGEYQFLSLSTLLSNWITDKTDEYGLNGS
jgi:[acyl-carrier-protein] S-malonyltransferase